MAKYEISNVIRDNILLFLKRVKIKGDEAPVIMEIIQLFKNPIVEKKEGKIKDKQRNGI